MNPSDKASYFKQLLFSNSNDVEPTTVLINLLLTGVLSFILKHFYIRYARSFSNRSSFASNFIILSMSTMLVISIIKSSLALSLGLVGALSIVRFRTAVKDPEELSYLFLNICIGLGLGANQPLITGLGLSIVLCFVFLNNLKNKSDRKNDNMYVTFSSNTDDSLIENVTDTLKEHCTFVRLKRYDEAQSDEGSRMIETSFLVEFKDIDSLKKGTDLIRQKDPQVKVSYMDAEGLH